MDDKIDYLRLFNAVFAAILFLWLVIRTFMRRREYPDPVKLFLHVIGFYVLGTVELSWELVGRDVEFGFWSVIFLVANLALFITLLMTQRKRPMIVHPEEMANRPVLRPE